MISKFKLALITGVLALAGVLSVSFTLYDDSPIFPPATWCTCGCPPDEPSCQEFGCPKAVGLAGKKCKRVK